MGWKPEIAFWAIVIKPCGRIATNRQTTIKAPAGFMINPLSKCFLLKRFFAHRNSGEDPSLISCEHLHDNFTVNGTDANADAHAVVIPVHNIGFMGVRIHPGVEGAVHRLVAGDIFRSAGKSNALCPHHFKRRAVNLRLMGEIQIGHHIFCLVLCCFRKGVAVGNRTYVVAGANVVDQTQ